MKKPTANHTLWIGILLITLFSSGCQNSPNTPAEPKAHLGEITLNVTGAPEARNYFQEGLLLLHSFEYSDARKAFIKAQEADSTMPMAYWGEAMTYNHPLWRNQKYEKGDSALLKLGHTPDERAEKTGTELELDFLEATEILYGEGTKFERDKAYARHMEMMYEKYPHNHEVAAFYALSLLGSVPVGRDEKVFEQGARIAQGIIKENPNHPGALHYLIHSYDDPAHAGLAIDAANSYAKVAPDAAHALHMPSHIYVALGMWDEVVSSNEASYEASVNRMKRLDLDNSARSYHAFHWLQYGYLQQGRHEKARELLMDMAKYTNETPSRGARDYLIGMKGSYLVETGNWDDEEVTSIRCDVDDLNISTRSADLFLHGMVAYHQADDQRLQYIIDSLADAREKAEFLVTDEGIPMCSSGQNRSAPNQLDIDQSHVMEMELRGMQAWLNNDEKKTEEWFQKAVDLQDKISYSYGPPVIPNPSYELYGKWLLEKNREKEALKQFEKALERGPGRALALKGKSAVENNK